MLQIFVDGEFVDTIFHDEIPAEGQTFESEAVTKVLGDREIDNISFVGTTVFITTRR